MGVQLKDILEYEEVELSYIANKKLAIDSFNMLYQFLASIRQPDGNPLTDSKGQVTSHLKGLFNRCVYFKKHNIKPVFVFDGEAPKLKEKERQQRRERRIEADRKYQEAVELDLMEDAKKYAQGMNQLNEEMVKEAKTLVQLFGFPVVQAPSEGEAQAAKMVGEQQVFASASQDFDSLLFGSKHLLRNISVSMRRKIPGSTSYKDIPIEHYDLEKNLERLHLSLDELVIVAILVGTDFNPGGIKGIGPKKAVKLVKEYRDRWDELFNTLDWYAYFTYPWIEVFNTFKKMKIEKVDDVSLGDVDKEGIVEFLTNRDFDEEMLQRSLKDIKNTKTLDSFF